MSGLTVLALIVASAYTAACLFWPLVACGRCKGSGRLSPRWDRGHARVCPRCKGTAWRPRMGATVARVLFARRR